MRKVKIGTKGLGLLLVTAILFTGTKPLYVSAAGTERKWSMDLPHRNGNYYLPFKNKETSIKWGYAKVTKMESSGVAIWFNTGTGLDDVSKITDVVKYKKKILKPICYNSNYDQGTSVDMGIENSDSTLFFADAAAGIVNYK